MTDTFTPNYRLTRTTYDTRQWQDKVNDNFTVLDAVIGNLFVIGGIKGVWQNATEYNTGDVVIDPDLGLLFQALQPHISSAGSVTFAEERALFPTRWAPYSQVLKFRGIWAPNTFYSPNEFVLKVDGDRTRYAIALVAHLSSSDFEVDLAAGKWQILVDNLVSFLQTGTGAIARQMQDKMRDIVSVMDFIPLSAPGFPDLHASIRNQTATTDLTVYINNALAAHYVVRFPFGRYIVNGTIVSPLGTRVMLGDGSAGTLLLVNHTGTVVQMSGAATDLCIIGGMTIHANDVTGPTAIGIDVAFPSTPAWPYPQFMCFDVEFRSNLGTVGPAWAQSWKRGIRLANVWNGIIENVRGSSYPELGNTDTTGFLEIIGAPTSASLVLRMHSVDWNYGQDGILCSAYTEGMNITQSFFVGVTNGIRIPSTTPVGGFAGIYRGEAITISESHIAAWAVGFNFDKVDHFFSDTCDIQRHNGSTSPSWVAYAYNDCNSLRIVGGSIAGNTGTAPAIGLIATGSTFEIVLTDVNLENLAIPFSLGASTQNAIIRGNNKSGLTTDDFAVGGAFHKIEWLNSLGETINYAIETNRPANIQENVSNGESGEVGFRKARAGKVIVQNTDIIGDIPFDGYDGTAYRPAALIRGSVGGVPGANDMPGRLQLLVSPDGTITPVAGVTIDAGNTDVTSKVTVADRVWQNAPIELINNAAGVTWSTANILARLLTRAGAAAVSDTTPTAAAIVAAAGVRQGAGEFFVIRNFNSGTLTILGGTGVTVTGAGTIAAGVAKLYLLRFDNTGAGTEAITLYSLMEGVI